MTSLFRILVSVFWASATLLKRMFYEAHLFPSVRFPIYTVSIGNIESGGTGKTPFLFELLREVPEEFHASILVLSRGYRSQDESATGVYPPGETAAWEKIGDENSILKKTFPRVWLAVGGNRVRSANAAFLRAKKAGDRFRLVILEDGFQHLAVARDFDFVLRTSRKWGETYFRDFGFVRKLQSATRQRWIFSKGRDFQVTVDGGKLQEGLDAHGWSKSGEPTRIHLVVGLGFPQALQDQLQEQASKYGWSVVQTTILPDHGFLSHDQWANLLATAEEKKHVVLVTEKDFVKTPPLDDRWMNRLMVIPHTVTWFTPRTAVFERILPLFENRQGRS